MSTVNATRPDLPAQTAQLRSSIRAPVITAIVGGLLFLLGLILGRIPYQVPGGYSWSAYHADQMCSRVGQLTGTAPATPMCTHAHAVLELCGVMIVGGLAAMVFGAVAAIRRLRSQRALQASMARHPAQGTRELA